MRIIDSSTLQWIEATVTSTHDPVSASDPSRARNIASCSLIDAPSAYHVWRVRKRLLQSIEILELKLDEELPKVGLRITFPDDLIPFAYICKNETSFRDSNGNCCGYLLYVMTLSGVAYLLNLEDFSAYISSYTFTFEKFIHINTPGESPITCVTATTGCLVIGREDGSVSCFQLDGLAENDQGLMYKFPDIPSPRLVGSVKELVVSDFHDGKVLFVLHFSGNLRVLDFRSRKEITRQHLGNLGTSPLRLWVGLEIDRSSIPISILRTHCSVAHMVVSRTLSLHRLHVFLQENYTSNNVRRAMQTCDSIEWTVDVDNHTIICPRCEVAVQAKRREGINFRDLSCCKGSYATTTGGTRFTIVKYVNWEFNGVFNVPDPREIFEHGLCWVFTLTDQIEAQYNVLYPKREPIKLSRQYILDYIPVTSVQFGSVFGYKLIEAYRWAVKNGLVLQKNYETYDHPYKGSRQPQGPIMGDTRVSLGELKVHLCDDEAGIDKALSQHPISCSMIAKLDEINTVNKNPCRPYLIFDDTKNDNKPKKHAVVLSGKVSYDPPCSLDSYMVKEAQGFGSNGRFFIKKESALVEGEKNAIRYVMYPSSIYLTTKVGN